MKSGNEVPRFRRSLFCERKIAYGTRRLRIGLSDLSDMSNENKHVNQMRKNCIFKNPNSLQEGPVFTPLVEGRPYTVNKQGAC